MSSEEVDTTIEDKKVHIILFPSSSGDIIHFVKGLLLLPVWHNQEPPGFGFRDNDLCAQSCIASTHSIVSRYSRLRARALALLIPRHVLRDILRIIESKLQLHLKPTPTHSPSHHSQHTNPSANRSQSDKKITTRSHQPNTQRQAVCKSS